MIQPNRHVELTSTAHVYRVKCTEHTVSKAHDGDVDVKEFLTIEELLIFITNHFTKLEQHKADA